VEIAQKKEKMCQYSSSGQRNKRLASTVEIAPKKEKKFGHHCGDSS